MNQKPPNARFWELINGSPVKITLQPGQELHHGAFYRHDEGWTRISNTWEHDGEAVTSSFVDDGVDCDGPLTRGGEYIAPLACLSENPSTVEIGDPAVRWPNWQRLDSYQRDAYAEAMGY